jgi:hypothetical protein
VKNKREEIEFQSVNQPHEERERERGEREERRERERERKCVITLGRHNTLHEPRLKISTEHACTCKP